MRKLALEVTSKELDLLIAFCDDRIDGRVNYKEFMKRFLPLKTEKLLNKRNVKRLKLIKEQIYDYLISPKDAFRYVRFSFTS